ncbi:hypothetical protein [Microcoleus sp. FACHB-672]|nr:hypothetical protein [Microcoleus sp. FACHB-672]
MPLSEADLRFVLSTISRKTETLTFSSDRREKFFLTIVVSLT